MTLYARDQTMGSERPPVVSASLLATQARRRTLLPRLRAAGIGCRVLLLQGAGEDLPPPPGLPVLPPLYAPLLLDTVGLTPTMQVRVLAELATGAPTVPTLLLTHPADQRLHWLAPSCPAVYALVSEELSPAELALWLRHPGAVGRARSPHVRPAAVGLRASRPPIVDPQLLALLAALTHAPTIAGAAVLAALSERTVYRKLAELRSALHLPGRLSRGRPAVLLAIILAALAEAPTCGS